MNTIIELLNSRYMGQSVKFAIEYVVVVLVAACLINFTRNCLKMAKCKVRKVLR